MNAMLYVRGNPKDYDDWEEKEGCKNWSYKKVLPYFKKAEKNMIDEYKWNGEMKGVLL